MPSCFIGDGNEARPVRHPPSLASTRVQADEACSATLAGWLLRWCGGRVFTKICMPPCRCLTGWPRGCLLPRRCLPSWLGWQLHANSGGVLAGAVLAVALLTPSARVLPWRAGVPDKDLAGGLVGFFGKDLDGEYCPPILI